jgi:hypothetical protein
VDADMVSHGIRSIAAVMPAVTPRYCDGAFPVISPVPATGGLDAGLSARFGIDHKNGNEASHVCPRCSNGVKRPPYGRRNKTWEDHCYPPTSSAGKLKLT